MENTRYNDLIKLVLAIALIIVVVIYPILNIDIPDIIINGFGSLVIFVLGVHIDKENINNGKS